MFTPRPACVSIPLVASPFWALCLSDPRTVFIYSIWGCMGVQHPSFELWSHPTRHELQVFIIHTCGLCLFNPSLITKTNAQIHSAYRCDCHHTANNICASRMSKDFHIACLKRYQKVNMNHFTPKLFHYKLNGRCQKSQGLVTWLSVLIAMAWGSTVNTSEEGTLDPSYGSHIKLSVPNGPGPINIISDWLQLHQVPAIPLL